MTSQLEQQPDAWQQNAIFTQLLQAPAAKSALATLERILKPIFNSHTYYSLETGMFTVKLHTLTSLLTNANLLPHFTSHDFKLGLHLAITPTLSPSASPSKNQPLHFDDFLNAVAFCAYYYPPETNPLQTPNPRSRYHSVGLEVAFNTTGDRLVAVADSPRSIVAKMASPSSPLPFSTPRTTFPESSPTASSTSATSASPGAEQWFTPAHSVVRNKPFLVGDSNASIVCQLDSESDACPGDVASHDPEPNGSVTDRDTKPEVCVDSPTEKNDDSDTAPQHSETEQQCRALTPSCASSEKPWHPSPSEEIGFFDKVEISPHPTAQSQANEEDTSLQKLESHLEGHCDRHDTCEDTHVLPPTAIAASPSVQAALMSTPEDEARLMESTESPKTTPEVTEDGSSESAPTNVSLAPSTVPSHLPSPGETFESPELAGDPGTPYNPSSVEPVSSRKLTFSDTDEASDDSSCYEDGSDNEDTMARIENAFENSYEVADSDEDDFDSDLASPYSQFRSSIEDEDIAMVQSGIESGTSSEQELANTCGPTPPDGEETGSALDTESQALANDYLDSHSVASENSRKRDSDYEAATPDTIDGIKESNLPGTLDATHNIALNEPTIALGLPAEAFSEAGSAMLQTPHAPTTAARFPDTDMEDEDEEEHTLLFDNGNESDGSDLSMHTRETMSKMVEDYLSLHGTASPPYDLGENFYAEDQVLLTPNRKSQEAFGDRTMTDSSRLVEDGPCVSEKAESKQLKITEMVKHSIRDFGKSGNRNKLGLKNEMAREQHDQAADALSPLMFSQKNSFSSEITPDGLNVIKKQLVLPSPFVFSDSTVGSSMSSGPSVQQHYDVKYAEESEQAEQHGIVAVPAKDEDGQSEIAVVCGEQGAMVGAREAELMRVMRETLETCRVLREEVATKEQKLQERPQRQHRGGLGRWIEFGIFGLVVVFVTLVLVERRIQRGLFLDVLV